MLFQNDDNIGLFLQRWNHDAFGSGRNSNREHEETSRAQDASQHHDAVQSTGYPRGLFFGDKHFSVEIFSRFYFVKFGNLCRTTNCIHLEMVGSICQKINISWKFHHFQFPLR